MVLVVKNPLGTQEMQEIWVQSLGRRDTWRWKWQTTPISCLENPKDRGSWLATVYGVAESNATGHTHTHTQTHSLTHK